MIREIGDSGEIADSNLDDYEAELREGDREPVKWGPKPPIAAPNVEDAVEESASKIESTPTRPDSQVGNVIPFPRKT